MGDGESAEHLELDENRRVLVIDDNADIHGDFRQVLGGAPAVDPLRVAEAALFGETAPAARHTVSFELAHAMQGQEGLERLRHENDAGRPFALAFVDMRMPPGWDGLTTIQRLWQADPRLQVVLCTAFSDHSWEQICEAVGPGDRLLILKKPFDVVELRQLALSLTTKWNLSRAAARSHRDLETAVEQRTAELRLAKETADRASRSKSDFLANVSHEIRTPLTAILGFAKLLIDGNEQLGPEQRGEYLHIIRGSAEHQLALINDLLDLSKVEAGQMGIHRVGCSPREIVADVVRTLSARAAEKRLSLESAWLGPTPEVIFTDPSRFRQLLLNLAANAVKFTDAGGVKLVCQLIASERRTRLKIECIDTGIGIAEEQQQSIFQPFVQADSSITRQYGGTGLGLAISRSIAAMLGGTLTVDSRPGEGSTFTAEIDAGPPEALVRQPAVSVADDTARPAVEQPAASIAGRKILVVEDNLFNQKLVRLGLERVGALVELAEHGQSGVSKAQAGDFDLILMDMQMPVMEGYAATRVLRQRGFDRPIVALTAHALEEERTRCLEAGCTAFVSKPIDLDHLVALIGRLLASGDAAPATQAPSVRHAYAEDADDAAAFGAIARDFLASLDEVLDRAGQAQSAGDLGTLAEIGHSLKGSGGTFGFPELTALGARLEEAALAADSSAIAAAIGGLTGFIERATACA
ncbi:MAG TPA: response regulator [Pirellulales bacterium]|nr:response regulator [Pirellulales bacterium]